MTLARLILWFDALLFGVIGALFLAAPVRWARVVEISVPTPMARTDLRATYGGFDLALGVFLALCAVRPEWYRPGLLVCALALFGFAAGRLLGIAVERTAHRLMLLFLAVELLNGGVALWAFRALSS